MQTEPLAALKDFVIAAGEITQLGKQKNNTEAAVSEGARDGVRVDLRTTNLQLSM